MSPSFCVFERSVLLAAPPEQVYAFHEDPRNIRRISPASLHVERVECTVPARSGERFSLLVRQFGLTLDWRGVWEITDAPERLVDGAIRSPFRHWRHHHLFEGVEGGGTLMTDRVEYALPMGQLGGLLDRTVMRVVFAMMFAARHRATAAFFAMQKA